MPIIDDYTKTFNLTENKEYTVADFRAMVAEFRDVVSKYETDFTDMQAKLEKTKKDNERLNEYNRSLFNKITVENTEKHDEHEESPKYDDYEKIVDGIIPRKKED